LIFLRYLAVNNDDSNGRVHALNLLRFLFLDKNFSLPAQPFFSVGFTTAFSALSSPHWPVRNIYIYTFIYT